MVPSGLLQAYLAIGASALLPIYFGSRASVKMPKQAKQAVKQSRPGKISKEEEEDEDTDEIDRLTSSEAWLFPVIGSVTLCGLFLAFKYLNKELINRILSSYFAILGTLGLARLGVFAARGVISKERYYAMERYKLLFTKGAEEYLNLKFTNLHLTFTLTSTVLSAYHLYTNDWIVSNLIGLAFSFNAVSLIRLDSFKTGTILLSGLFLYDIYWVFFSSKTFGTSVMVAVATNFEAPIKIVYPKDVFASKFEFTMLGLGDIVIPGIFVALALRFDYYQAVEKALRSARGMQAVPTPDEQYPKPYFKVVLMNYILGLATTIVVMHTYRAAQPALLYLSPACILGVLVTAAVRGELGEVWKYTDEDEEKEGSKPESASDASHPVMNGDASASPPDDAIVQGLSSALEGNPVTSHRVTRSSATQQAQDEQD